MEPVKQGNPPVVPGSSPTYLLKELMGLISQIEDESSFYHFKQLVDQGQDFYHREQTTLLNAHLFSRFQYLYAAGRLAKRG